jgi:hypothetical protein
VGATAATCLHPSVSPPSVVANTSAPLAPPRALLAPCPHRRWPPSSRPFLPRSRRECPSRGRRRALGRRRRRWRPRRHCRARCWPLCHRSRRWHPCLVVLRPVDGRSPVLVDVAHLLCGTLVWASGAACLAVLLGPIHGRSPVLVDVARLLHGTLVWLPVQQVGSSFTLPPPQQSPSSTPWFGEWDPQSLIGCLSSTVPTPPTSVTDWVADSGATNHTPPHPVTSSHPGLRRLPTIPTSLLVMVLSCSSPQ